MFTSTVVSFVVRNTIFRKAPPSRVSGYGERSIDLNKVVATFEKHTFLSQTDLTRTGIISNSFFPQNLTLGYMTKTLNQIIFFFPPPKSEYFFSNIGNQNIFLENQLLAHSRWFSLGTPATSTTKTGHHDIAEILLKVALNTKNHQIIHVER